MAPLARLLSTFERVGTTYRGALARGLLAGLAMMFVAQAPAETIGPAVEYYHAGFDHYFVTANPDEIAILDGGAYGGAWRRTGETFAVWTQPQNSTVDACRFFSATFAPKSSHFYTPYAPECASLRQGTTWSYEGIAFYLRLTDSVGACPAGTVNLYRLYNNGAGDAPNHRYAVSRAVFDQMRAAGWSPEGNGPMIAFACVPPTTFPTTAQGLWGGTTATNANVYGVVFADGTFYFLYSLPNSIAIGGFIVGRGTSANGTFQSTTARDFNFVPSNDDFPATISGSYVAGSRLAGTIVEQGRSVGFTLSYADDSMAPPSLADAAGTYTGSAAWGDGTYPATLTLTASGALTGSSGGCTLTGTATPRSDVRVFDLTARASGGNCGSDTMTGVAAYDSEEGQGMLFAAAATASVSDGFVFVGSR